MQNQVNNTVVQKNIEESVSMVFMTLLQEEEIDYALGE